MWGALPWKAETIGLKHIQLNSYSAANALEKRTAQYGNAGSFDPALEIHSKPSS